MANSIPQAPEPHQPSWFEDAWVNFILALGIFVSVLGPIIIIILLILHGDSCDT